MVGANLAFYVSASTKKGDENRRCIEWTHFCDVKWEGSHIFWIRFIFKGGVLLDLGFL